ncbi:MAG: hypothetical protein ACOYO1_06530 [Bacteroidales bacterium]
MKRKLLFMLTALLSLNFFIANATIRTVSNRADKPAQYTLIQNAINASAMGDTILIAGSATVYAAALTIDRRLIFFGEGMNNPDGQSTTIDGNVNLNNVNNAFGASGSKFFGISFTNPVLINGNFTGQLVGQNKIENVDFDRCSFTYYINMSGQIYNNITLRNCLFNGAYIHLNSSIYTNFLITNSVFSTNNTVIISTNNVNGQVFVRNCNFMNRTGDVLSATGLVVENCIFYQAQPTGAFLSTFNNNLTYFNNSNSLPYGNNAGGGNIAGANPLFTNFPALGGTFSWTQDFALLPGSPAIGTGTNNTNIGITGGNSPCLHNLPGNSKLPVVTQLTVPVSSVPVGGTLQINLKAKTRK